MTTKPLFDELEAQWMGQAVQFFSDRPWPDGVMKACDGDYCVVYTDNNGRTRVHEGDWVVPCGMPPRYRIHKDVK